MICPSCKFDNKDGAVFCANCGSKLSTDNTENKTVIITEENNVAAPEKNDMPVSPTEIDDSESNTTVLTSELKGPGPIPVPGTPAPMGFSPAPMNSNQAPVNGMAPMGGVPMNGAPMNGAPMGGMPPLNNAPNNQAKPGKAPKQPKAPKAPKAPKQPKAPKNGAGTGTKVYIAISIIAILALAGVLVYGVMQLNDKKDELDNVNSELASMTDARDDIASELEAEQAASETYVSQIDELNNTVSTLETENASLTTTIDGYTPYDSLISFSESQTSGAEAEFFASHTVLHLKDASTSVRVYFPIDGGTVYFGGNDESVAICEWDSEWINDSVATLYVSPVASGNTVITLTNDQTSAEIKIYVYVD